jgi:hypothetical protein
MGKERRRHELPEVLILVGGANADLDWAERAQNHSLVV